MPASGGCWNMRPRFFLPVLVAAAAVGTLLANDNARPQDDFIRVEVATVGMDPLTGVPVVLLRELGGSGRFLAMSIGPNEAHAIGRAMMRIEPPRPMTHDLMQSLLEAADFDLQRVVVDDFRAGTYFATIHGTRGRGGEAVTVDRRPSDAIALAVRTASPILVADRLLEGLEAPPQQPMDADQLFHVSGLTVTAASAQDLQQAGIDDGQGALRVVAVHDALRDQVRMGDLVVSAAGRRVTGVADLMEALRGNRGEKSIRLILRRGAEEFEVDLPTSGEQPARPPRPGSDSPITV